jgi:hypothetical protein
MPNAPPRSILVAPEVLGAGGRIYPIVVSLVVFAAGLLLFRREEPWVAERI